MSKGSTQAADEEPLEFTEKHRLLKLRLTPVREVQKDLERKLGSGAFEEVAGSAHSPLLSSAISVYNDSTSELDEPQRRDPHEFYIRSNNSWKERVRSRAGSRSETFKQREEIAGLIAGCKEDMKAVWEDPIIQVMLRRRKFRLEDSPGLSVFFFFEFPNLFLLLIFYPAF
jgi:guanine nucleotide-binding protein alpha-1 subunit